MSMRPVKTQISLGIRPVHPRFLIRLGGCPTWSESAHSHFVGFVMSWLSYYQQNLMILATHDQYRGLICVHCEQIFSFKGKCYAKYFTRGPQSWFPLFAFGKENSLQANFRFLSLMMYMCHVWTSLHSIDQLSHLMRLWYFSSSINTFFKCPCAAIQWGTCLIFGWTLHLLPYLCVRTAKALARLCGCAGSLEPSLVAYVIKYHNLRSWLYYFSYVGEGLPVEDAASKLPWSFHAYS